MSFFDDMKLKVAFKYFDKDGSGYIEAKEIEALLVRFLHIPEKAAGPTSKAMVKYMDKSNDGKLSFDEFKMALDKVHGDKK